MSRVIVTVPDGTTPEPPAPPVKPAKKAEKKENGNG